MGEVVRSPVAHVDAAEILGIVAERHVGLPHHIVVEDNAAPYVVALQVHFGIHPHAAGGIILFLQCGRIGLAVILGSIGARGRGFFGPHAECRGHCGRDQ